MSNFDMITIAFFGFVIFFIHYGMPLILNYRIRGNNFEIVLFSLIVLHYIKLSRVTSVKKLGVLENLFEIAFHFRNRLLGKALLIAGGNGLFDYIIITPDKSKYDALFEKLSEGVKKIQ